MERKRYLVGRLLNNKRLSVFSDVVKLSVLLLSTLSVTSVYGGLTASTSRTIQGSKPYLAATHMADITSGDPFQLFVLKVAGNTYEDDSAIASKIGTSFLLGSKTPQDLLTLLGDGATEPLIGTYVTLSMQDVDDDDGDSNFVLSEPTIGWFYQDEDTNQEIELSSEDLPISYCQLLVDYRKPYLKVSGPFTLSTQYGNPLTQIYDAANVNSPLSGGKDAFKNFKVVPISVCFARPNLNMTLGDAKWSQGNGFIQQSLTTPSLNFPTVGSKGFYFDLVLLNGKAQDVITATAPSGVYAPAGSDIKLILSVSDDGENILNVLLDGPDDTTHPTQAYSPTTFELKSSDNTVLYSFTISKWFITKSQQVVYSSDDEEVDSALNYCTNLTGLNSTAYRIPSVNEYTDQFIGSFIPGTTLGGRYTRKISGSLFSEWGAMNKQYYATSDWNRSTVRYWASEAYSSDQYIVNPNSGSVSYISVSSTSGVACVSP